MLVWMSWLVLIMATRFEHTVLPGFTACEAKFDGLSLPVYVRA